jgi:hypothetical protein
VRAVPGNRSRSRIPEGIDLEALTRFYRIGKTHQTDLLEYNTFTGSQIQPLMYVPPNPEAEGDRRLGSFTEWGDVQTITISSHRPPIPVRVLGSASPAGFGRSVRTFGGTIIFNRVDKDAFVEGWAKSELERPDIVPFFTDAMPPFHILLHAQNEMGLQASAGILDVHLGDYGTAYTIEDLVPEVTYSYVARYIHPFMDRDNWRHNLRDAVTKLSESESNAVSQFAPPETEKDVFTEDFAESMDDWYKNKFESPWYKVN